MRDVYIYEAIRTPRGKGKADGALHTVPAVDLLKTLMTELQSRHSLDTSLIDDVVLGCVTAVGEQGADIARTAVLHSGWDQRVAGVTLNRYCASGLEAVNLAAMKIMSGQAEMTVGGGIEAMSRVPMGADGGALMTDQRIAHDVGFVPQGISADLIATLENYSRQQLDQFAAESHRRASAAQAAGYFKNSVVPVKDINGHVLLDQEEIIRPATTAESLAQLKPSFAKMGATGFDNTALNKYTTIESIEHRHHAGNSSGIVDGASIVLLGSKAAGEKMGLKPRGKIRATAVIGSEPTIMLTGIAPATQKALKLANMPVKDIDLFEINEAFAAVVLKAMQDLDIEQDKVNVNGGSIAMGHPLGATGAMILGTALDELERRDANTAVATLCVGGGMGIATVIERV